MDFVTKSFRKDETLTSWTLSQHICPHFWAWLLNTIAITPKSEDKYVVKVFNSSEFHLSEMTLLQNPYFRTSFASSLFVIFCFVKTIWLIQTFVKIWGEQVIKLKCYTNISDNLSGVNLILLYSNNFRSDMVRIIHRNI